MPRVIRRLIRSNSASGPEPSHGTRSPSSAASIAWSLGPVRAMARDCPTRAERSAGPGSARSTASARSQSWKGRSLSPASKRALATLLGGDPSGRADVERALGLANAMHDDLGAARAHHILGAAWTDDVASAVHHVASAGELVARHGMLLPQAFYSALSGYLLAVHGEWDAAESRVDETTHLLARVGRDVWTTFNLIDTRGRVALGRGDLDAAVRHFRELVAAEELTPDFEDQADAYSGLATALLCSGRTDEIDEAIEKGLRILPRLSGETWLRTIVVGVEAHLAAGRLAQARGLAAAAGDDAMRPYLADAARALGDLNDGAVVAAAATADRVGAHLDGAVLRVGAAIVMAVYPEHRPGAARLARSAHARFRELGSDAWCRRLEGMLRTLGHRAPTPHEAGAGGLSARELEVLGLVAEGLTNRQIAERLQVTQHTAIRHVANIMAKLGAPSRAAAVRIAAERGILGPRTPAG